MRSQLRLGLGVVLVLLASACGDDPPKAYDDYQSCFDEKTQDEGATVIDAIVSCCLDHPIADARPACGADSPACINYLTDNLSQIVATPADRAAACETYVMELPPAE